MTKSKHHFQPPRHPNWTGRAYRSSQEAFGYQWSAPTQPARLGVVRGIYIAGGVIICALAASVFVRSIL